MRKILLILLTLCLIIGLTACSGGKDADEAAETENEQAAAEEQADDNGSGNSGKETLVVYFSATGNTKAVAKKSRP